MRQTLPLFVLLLALPASGAETLPDTKPLTELAATHFNRSLALPRPSLAARLR